MSGKQYDIFSQLIHFLEKWIGNITRTLPSQIFFSNGPADYYVCPDITSTKYCIMLKVYEQYYETNVSKIEILFRYLKYFYKNWKLRN